MTCARPHRFVPESGTLTGERTHETKTNNHEKNPVTSLDISIPTVAAGLWIFSVFLTFLFIGNDLQNDFKRFTKCDVIRPRCYFIRKPP